MATEVVWIFLDTGERIEAHQNLIGWYIFI